MEASSLSERAMPFPFSAIVGHDKAKLALIVSLIDPQIGGVLVRGPKGSGKSLLVNGLEGILPDIDVVEGCKYNCSPDDPVHLCFECQSKLKKSGKLPVRKRKMRIVRLPIGATEDRVLGGVDLESAIAHGTLVLQPGLLAEANRNILYVDQIDLLSEHLVDSMLDAAASGWTRIEREGLSVAHPSRFTLIGSMSPEEGELRPQIMDRFSIQASTFSEENPDVREEILRRNMEFDENSTVAVKLYGQRDERLRERIAQAISLVESVKIPDQTAKTVARICSELKVDGHRPDIVTLRTARAIAAYEGRPEVSSEDILLAAELSLAHRPRSFGTVAPPSMTEIRQSLRIASTREEPLVPLTSSRSRATPREVRTTFHLPPMFPGRARRMSVRQVLMKLALALALPILHFALSATLVTLVLLSIQGFLGTSLAQTLEAYWIQYWIAIIGIFLILVVSFYRRREVLYVPDLRAEQLSRLLVEKQIIADEPSLGMAFDIIDGVSPVYQLVPLEVDMKASKIAAFLDKGPKTLAKLFRWPESKPPPRELAPTLERRVRPLRRYIIGRYSKTESHAEAGRYVTYELPRRRRRDIAFGPTIRAAAAHPAPVKDSPIRVKITPSDLRVKVREHKVPLSTLLVLDMSESMVSSLDNVSKAILSLHRTASRKRDRVGLVVFKGSEAIVLQHPTRNLRQVVNKLLDLGASDFTPLAAGMLKALNVLRLEVAKSKDSIPVMAMITDGIVNVPLSQPLNEYTRKDFMNSAQADVVDAARLIAKHGIRTVIINTDHRQEHIPEDRVLGRKRPTPTELLMDVAKITKGRYYGLTLPISSVPARPSTEETPTLLSPLIRRLSKS